MSYQQFWFRRHFDRYNDAPEVEELQTDVMRFIAIIGLCLVAIFALLHGISTTETEKALDVSTLIQPIEDSAQGHISPVSHSLGNLSNRQRPEGYSLEFASSEALNFLISTKRLKFFAVVGDDSWRLSIRQGTPRFDASDTPYRFHEMQVETVPEEYYLALEETGGITHRSDAKWGVVLPRPMTEEIDRIVRQARSGTLIIQKDGRVTRTPSK